MSRASYHAHKSKGLCGACGLRPHLPGQSRCDPCLEKARFSEWNYRGVPGKKGRALMPTIPLLAHCRMWHKVSAVPFTAPCCGTKLFEEC